MKTTPSKCIDVGLPRLTPLHYGLALCLSSVRSIQKIMINGYILRLPRRGNPTLRRCETGQAHVSTTKIRTVHCLNCQFVKYKYRFSGGSCRTIQRKKRHVSVRKIYRKSMKKIVTLRLLSHRSAFWA